MSVPVRLRLAPDPYHGRASPAAGNRARVLRLTTPCLLPPLGRIQALEVGAPQLAWRFRPALRMCVERREKSPNQTQMNTENKD